MSKASGSSNYAQNKGHQDLPGLVVIGTLSLIGQLHTQLSHQADPPQKLNENIPPTNLAQTG
jgi:hypothetical protein